MRPNSAENALGIFNFITGLTLDLAHPNPNATSKKKEQFRLAAQLSNCEDLFGAALLLNIAYDIDTDVLTISQTAERSALAHHTTIKLTPDIPGNSHTAQTTTTVQKNMAHFLQEQRLDKRPLMQRDAVKAMQQQAHQEKAADIRLATSGDIPLPKTECIRLVKDNKESSAYDHFNLVTRVFILLADQTHLYFTDCYDDLAQLKTRLTDLLKTLSKQLGIIKNRFENVRKKNDGIKLAYTTACDVIFLAASRCIVLSHIVSMLHAYELPGVINAMFTEDIPPIIALKITRANYIPAIFAEIREMTLSELLPADLRAYFRGVTWKIQEAEAPLAVSDEALTTAGGGVSDASAAASGAAAGLFEPKTIDSGAIKTAFELLKHLGDAADQLDDSDEQKRTPRAQINAAIRTRNSTTLNDTMTRITEALDKSEPGQGPNPLP